MPNNDYVKREDIYPAVTEIAKEIVFGDQDDDKVVDIINSIPAADVEPKRRWIPVTEQYPKKHIAVLVWQPNYLQGFTAVWDGIDWYLCGGFGIKMSEISHWMPLPELPKGEEDG